MNDALITALARFIGLIILVGLTALFAWSCEANITWLFITMVVIFAILGLGVLFACMYAVAQREQR